MWKRASVELSRDGNHDGESVEDAGFFQKYVAEVGETYSKPWPRPWPCGTVWLKWDPRWVEPMTYRLNPANGVFTLELKITPLNGRERTAMLTAFVDWDSGRISVESDPIPEISIIYSPAIDGFHAGAFDSGHIETIRISCLDRS